MSPKVNITIVEDNAVERQVLTELIISLQYNVESHESAEAALAKLKEFKPEIILLDIHLPGMSGLDMLARIRSDREVANIPVMLLSSDSDYNIVAEGLSLGANDYLRKPANLAELTIRLGNLIETTRLKEDLKKTKKRLEHEHQLLSRYISSDFQEALLKGDLSADIGGSIHEATLLVCDLRNSTTIAEAIDPNDFANFLGEFFADISDLIFGHMGSITSFRGDGFLASFGVIDKKSNHEENAVKAALAIRDHLKNFNRFRPKFIRDDIQMGLGIASGRIFSGNVGTVQRQDFTVLGDPVNLAARLESLTKVVGVDILCNGEVRDALQGKVKFKKVRLTQVRGKIKEVRIYHPFETIKE